ncbi:MAG: DMT family transporter [Gemmatimonadales bacterium]
MTHRRAVLILLGCTFVWGASFTLNKMVLASVTPLVFMAARFGVSALLVAPVYRRTTRADWWTGLPLGALFGVQLALFVLGLDRIEPARAAFIFSFQTPLVPVLMLLAHRQGPTRRDGAAVALAVLGAWWLTSPAGGGFGLGDLAMFGSACGAALYVVAAGAVTGRHEPLRLLAVQFVSMAFVGLGLALAFEPIRFRPSAAALVLIPFLALSSIATFGGQLLGQQRIRPTEASLLYALEPLVAAGTSYVSFGERLSGWQWLGGLTIVAASFVAQGKPADRANPSPTVPVSGPPNADGG